MWYSFGDKYKIIKDRDDRKIRTNPILLFLFLALFVVNTWTFQKHFSFNYDIVWYVAIALCSVLLFVKYVKNNKEVDFSLIATIIVSLFLLMISNL